MLNRRSNDAWDVAVLDALGCCYRDTTFGTAAFAMERIEPSHRVGPYVTAAAVANVRALCRELTGIDGHITALDVETTGLGGAGCIAFIVGIAHLYRYDIELRQYVLADYPHEPGMLVAVAEDIQRADILLTFNGRRFDWPALASRYPLYTLSPPSEPTHIDMLYPARLVWKERFHSCRLQHLERLLLGIEREDDVPSHLIPAIYFDYLRCGRARLLAPALRHNRSDLLSLIGIASSLGERLRRPLAVRDMCELAGLGRLLESLGKIDAGTQCYECAAATHAGAAHRLVRLYKRQGDYERAARICRDVIARLPSAIWAYEELARHLEHRQRQPAAALDVVVMALRRADFTWRAPLLRRLRRLQRKCNRETTGELSGD